MTATTWQCPDGGRLQGDVFEADVPLARAVLAPGMGIPRGFYRRFAAYLAGRGIATVTFDYGDRPGTRMSDWGRRDLETVLAAQPADLPLFLVGHSCGGQLAGLAPSARRLSGLVLVAAQSGHWRHWHGRGRLGMWLLWHVLIPLLAHGRRFPARRLGMFGRDVPAGVARQWAQWGRRRRYLFEPSPGLDTALYRELAVPALAYGFADDGYAPAPAIDALLAEYPRLTIDRRQITPADAGLDAIGHMGFFREGAREALWQPTADWLLTAARETESRHG